MEHAGSKLLKDVILMQIPSNPIRAVAPGTHPYNPHTPDLVQPSPHHGDKEINTTLPSVGPRPIVQSNWRGRNRKESSRRVFWWPCGLKDCEEGVRDLSTDTPSFFCL